METILGLLVFFGLGLLALLILTLSAIWSRSVTAVLIWGVIAIGLMGLECMLLIGAAGIASATSGSQHGYNYFTGALVVFLVSLVLYFSLALGRLAGKK